MPAPHEPAVARIAVIGGGLSGLTAAFRLRELANAQNRPISVTLFEASNRLGGVMGTESIGGYTVELGADSFITNKPYAISLCRRLGLESELIPTDPACRGALVLRNGRPFPVPEGFQLLAPGNIWAVLKSPILSWGGKLRLALERFVPPANLPDETVAAFVRRRFGPEALDRLIQPLVGGIYTSDPEKLSLRATMPRFLDMEREHGSLIRAMRKERLNQSAEERSASGARYGLFLTPRNGISQLLDALRARVEVRDRIQTGVSVESVSPHPGAGFDVRIAGAGNQTFDAVVLATPAYRTADLVRPFDPDLASELGRIEYASTAIVVSGHKLTDVRDPLKAFGLVIPAIEQRRILAVSFTSRKFPTRAPEGCVMLRTFVGGAMQSELLQHNDVELIQLVREELRDLLGVTGEPDFVRVARWDRSMPQYHVGHLDRVNRIETLAGAYPRLSLAGNAFAGVGIPDVIHTAEQAAERALAGLADGR
jgi:oxygen-dependent protoporphyrinogen oxidase